MAAVSKQENAIVVDHVKKHFKVFLDKGQSFKERLLFRKRRRYENRQVLRDISFTVKRGEAVGLIGHNGCGKSTTLKLLTRILYPDSGTITIQGRVSSLIELGAGFHPDMSGREYLYQCLHFRAEQKGDRCTTANHHRLLRTGTVYRQSGANLFVRYVYASRLFRCH